MSVQAAELIGTVEIVGADEAIALLNEVGTAVDTLNAQLATLGADSGAGITASLDAADASLVTLQTTADETTTTLAALGGDTVGLDTLVTQADAATVSLDTLDMSAQQFSASVAGDADATIVLADSLDSVSVSASAANGALAGTDASLASVGTAADAAATGASTAAVGLKEMGASAEADIGMFAGLEGAMGPLMMIGAAALIAGGEFIKMGEQGQEGEALLRGMAGASQQDIDQLMVVAQQLGVNMNEAAQGFYQVESAGYSGAQALVVFTDAEKLAEGGQAQASDVMSGLTAIMHDYGSATMSTAEVTRMAAQDTDIMAEAVLRGKQSMQDFAHSIGPLAAAGQKAGLSFKEVAAAEATMTQINPHVRQDTMQLASLFSQLDPKMGTVATAAKKIGLSFNEAHFASLNLLGKLQYLSQIAGGDTTPAFQKLMGKSNNLTAAFDLLQGHANAFKNNLTAMNHSAGTTEHAFQQWENTIPGALGHVGASLSILSTKLMDALGPKVGPIIAKVSDAISKIATPQNINAFGNTIGRVFAFIQTAIKNVTPYFQQIGSTISSMMSVAVPAFQHLMTIIGQVASWFSHNKTVMEAFKISAIALGIAIGAILVIALAAVVVVVGALVLAVMVLMAPLIGIILLVKNWGNIMNWLKGIFNDVVGFIGGLIAGIVNWLVAPIRQGVEAVVQWFSWLYNHNYYFKNLVDSVRLVTQIGIAWLENAWKNLVSALTSLWNLILNTATHTWDQVVSIFQGIWGRISGPLNTMKTNITTVFTGLMNSALNWGHNFIQGFINGITGMLGAVASTAANVAATLGKFLGFHSPAKEGPGSELDIWGPNLVKGFSQGILKAAPELKTSLNMLMQPVQQITNTLATGANGGSTLRFPSMNATTGAITVQVPPTNLYIDGRRFATSMLPHTVNAVRLASGKWPS